MSLTEPTGWGCNNLQSADSAVDVVVCCIWLTGTTRQDARPSASTLYQLNEDKLPSLRQIAPYWLRRITHYFSDVLAVRRAPTQLPFWLLRLLNSSWRSAWQLQSHRPTSETTCSTHLLTWDYNIHIGFYCIIYKFHDSVLYIVYLTYCLKLYY